jgi:hypothetical protein
MVNAAVAVDAGELPFGGGLLAIVRPAIESLQPGGVLTIFATAKARDDLLTWCRVEHHRHLAIEALPDGREQHLIERGSLAVPLPFEPGDPSTGFAPPCVRVEPGGPAYPFTLLDAPRSAPPEAAQLYAQAIGAQWDAERDVPWATVRPLPPALERAVAQVFAFLAENELSALYVPSRFVARLHPAYLATAQFLATQLVDEARHIAAFLRRAHWGPPALSTVTTRRSLLTLLELEDFTEASFLLSVLGEGTFLDLLRFVEQHAPDEATAALARRARIDEARHVHFGIAHVRHALAADASLFARLEAAVRRRAATLPASGAVPGAIQDALTIYAARGDDAPSVARGHEAFRELMSEMFAARVTRIETAGFTRGQAEVLSGLHTPNFM